MCRRLSYSTSASDCVLKTGLGSGSRSWPLLAGTIAFSQHVWSSRLSSPSVMCEVLRRCTQDTNCELSCAAAFQSRVTPRPCTST